MTRRRAWRLTEPPPPTATPLAVQQGVRRIVAPNAGPMTYNGTNSWLVDWAGGTIVIDPGSDDPAHLAAIMSAAETGGGLTHILLTHTHADHLGGARRLAEMTGAPVAGFRVSEDPGFVADIPLDDGASIGGVVALHTPGHASDHLCFVGPDGILFSGDHVMGWSTSVVPPPPRGDLLRFLGNLERLRDRGDRLILSAHGPAIEEPATLVQALIDHRLARERTIEALLSRTPQAFESVLARAYVNLRPQLHGAARANLMAHLLKLEADGRAAHEAGFWRSIG